MDIEHRLYRAAQVRELDRRAIEDHGIAGITLMERAGAAVLRAVRARFPEAGRILVCCGGGNNGGDGYIVARRARDTGLDAVVVALKPPEDLAGDARRAAEAWIAAGGRVEAWSGALPAADVIVDALLGTGLDRDVEGRCEALIGAINTAAAGVVAVDIPSGLHADTGQPLGIAVRADATVSFIGQKCGAWTGRAADFTGTRVFDRLGVPEAVYRDLDPGARLLEARTAGRHLPARRPTSHKGDFGHVLVCGGDFGMPGACALAARAALVCGSGLVSVATRRDHALHMAVGLPEAMWADGEDGAMLDRLVERADVIALGPGLGRSEWSGSVWKRLLAPDRPVVLDADGLNLLAAHGHRRSEWVLTPHPGEAARLLGVDTRAVQADRFAAAGELAERFDAVVVLKGAGSLIAEPGGRIAVCAFGTPAMAAAGMGDTLTGIIASLIGQGLDLYDAACTGVVLHARAGERAGRGRRALLAGDLTDALPGLLA